MIWSHRKSIDVPGSFGVGAVDVANIVIDANLLAIGGAEFTVGDFGLPSGNLNGVMPLP